MRAHRILLLSLCLLAVAYAVLLFVGAGRRANRHRTDRRRSGAGFDTLCVACKFLALFNEA